MSKAEAFFKEASQFVPVITLASSFIVGGGVDLSRAATLFIISAGIAVVVTVFLVVKKASLNPILLGTNLWLCLGAIAFGIPIPAFALLLGHVQAFGLYVCVFGIGLILASASKTGYIGMRHPDRKVVRRLSLLLLALTAVALAWSFVFIENIRLGGALPFIILNVTRRMLMRRNRPKN
jgi:hypothetical protein